MSNALKDFHAVRDAVKAVSGTVNKALGKDDNAASRAPPPSRRLTAGTPARRIGDKRGP